MRKLTMSIVLLFLFFTTCDIVESNKENKENKTTHPTEYSWTIDTLIIGKGRTKFYPEDILYNNENDIYIVGLDQIRYYNVYFHYNGKEWREHKIWSLDEANSICKIEDTIYLVGADTKTINGEEEYVPRIVKYNGSEWVKELTVIKENKSRISTFEDIWGHQKNDIWICGLDGLMYHYNGQDWVDYSMADTIWISEISGNSSNNLYASAYYLYSLSDGVNYILRWNGKEWRIEDKYFTQNYDYRFYPFDNYDIYVSDEYIYSCGYGVFRKRPGDDEWRKLFQHESAAYYDVSGSGPDNIYTIGQWGVANYYDGEKWFVLDSVYQNKDLIYTNTWTDGNQAFIIGYDYNNRGYVLHGK